MSNGTGQVPAGPTLSTILASIGAARAAHTAAESAIFGAYALGLTFAGTKPSILALKQANADLNTQLDLLITNLGL